MNTSIWEVLANTPWWFYALFIYMMRIGYLATKPRVIPFTTLFILPFILIVLSIISFFSIVTVTLTNAAIWIAAMLLGIALGWLRSRMLQVKAIKAEKKIYLPGSWGLLLLILVMFSIRYYFGFQAAIDTNIFLQNKYSVWSFLLYGLVTGLFVGRIGYAIKCLKVGPYFTA